MIRMIVHIPSPPTADVRMCRRGCECRHGYKQSAGHLGHSRWASSAKPALCLSDAVLGARAGWGRELLNPRSCGQWVKTLVQTNALSDVRPDQSRRVFGSDANTVYFDRCHMLLFQMAAGILAPIQRVACGSGTRGHTWRKSSSSAMSLPKAKVLRERVLTTKLREARRSGKPTPVVGTVLTFALFTRLLLKAVVLVARSDCTYCIDEASPNFWRPVRPQPRRPP